MTKPLRKEFDFGLHNVEGEGPFNRITIEANLRYKDGKPCFSASGYAFNRRGNDTIMGGQCIDDLGEWIGNNEAYKSLLCLWQRNHLNEMNAGTPEQTKAVEEWKAQGNTYDYGAVVEYLKSINMHEVDLNGEKYKYGHAWLYREISPEDLSLIEQILS